MRRTGIRIGLALLLAVAGCSSSDGAKGRMRDGDASTCRGAACTGGTGGSPATDGGGNGGSGAGAGGSGGAAVANLCPRQGPVTGPFPSSVDVAFTPAPNDDSVDDLIATDSVVLWKDQSKIVRFSLADGSATTVVDDSGSGFDHRVVSFAADDQNVYFSDSVAPRVTSLGLARFPLAGSGSPTTVVNDPNVGLITVSEGYVYFEDQITTGTPQSGIARVSTTGGQPTELLRGVLGGLRGLAVGGGHAYFFGTIGVNAFSNLYLARVPVTAVAADGGTPTGGADAGVAPAGAELVATTGLHTAGPVTDSTNVYWGDGDKVMVAPLSGGAPGVLAQADVIGGPLPEPAVIQGLAPRGDSIYWSSTGCQALRKTPVGGGTTVTLVPRVSALAIAVNSTHTYFVPRSGQVLSGPL